MGFSRQEDWSGLSFPSQVDLPNRGIKPGSPALQADSLLTELQKPQFPGGSVVKNPPANAGLTGGVGSSPWLGRSPGGGNGNPLQYSCLGNSMDRGSWRATVHGVAKSQTQLSEWTFRQTTDHQLCSEVTRMLNWGIGHLKKVHQDERKVKFKCSPQVFGLKHNYSFKIRPQFLPTGVYLVVLSSFQNLFAVSCVGDFFIPLLLFLQFVCMGAWVSSHLLCLTFCDPMNHSPPGSSVHGILQARILEWIAMPSSEYSLEKPVGTPRCCCNTSWDL